MTVTPFEFNDWGLKIINVSAKQVGPASCPLADIIRRPGSATENVPLCTATLESMTLSGVNDWKWVRPDQQRVRDWLVYSGANGLVVADGIAIFWEKGEIRMTGSFTATALGSSEFVRFTLSLTHQSESDWRRILREQSLRAVLKALPGLNRTYAQSNSVPSFINLPEGMVFVALALDSTSPIRFRLYAQPEGHPALITAFTGSFDANDELSWSEPRALLPAEVILRTREADLSAIAELAALFSSRADPTNLGRAMALRDMFETSLRNLASKNVEPVNIRATLDKYEDYEHKLSKNQSAKVLAAWKNAREGNQQTLDQARQGLEQRLIDTGRSQPISLAWPQGAVRAELLDLLKLHDTQAAEDYVRAQLSLLVTKALRSFSANGGLFQCWSSFQDFGGSSERSLERACTPPKEAVARVIAQIAQHFALGNNLNAKEYNDKVKKLRDRLNNPPAPLTSQQLLESAHELRLSVANSVEQSVRNAWAAMAAEISSSATGGALASLIGVMKDPTLSANLYHNLRELNDKCSPKHKGCSDVLISLALSSLYSDDTLTLTSGLQPYLERTTDALIPRPDIVYGSASGKVSDAERALSSILTDAGSKLSKALGESADDILRGTVTTAGMMVREANAFLPAVEARNGALYVRFNSDTWGARKDDLLLGVNCQADG